MRLGSIVRRILGPRLFPAVGRVYRSFFIDLDNIAQYFPPLSHARVLDIGGGDGEIINRLFARFPNMQVTMIDIAPQVGTSIKPEYSAQVALLPNTSIEDYGSAYDTFPDVIILSCVLHHIPRKDRPAFFVSLKDFIASRPVKIVILELEPGYFRSFFGLLSDRHITGDKQVAFIKKTELIETFKLYFPQVHCEETALFARDKPNYCLIFTINCK